jgi:predicted RNA-binding Zn-ribbon protein involved in translation (DUF1610 family)
MTMKEWIQGYYPCPKCGKTNEMIGRYEPCDLASNFFYYECKCGAKSNASRPELTLRDLREEEEE